MILTIKNRPLMAFTLLCMVLWTLLSPGPGSAEDISVSATLEPAVFKVDQFAQLTVTVIGTRSVEMELPEVEGIEIYRRGQSSQLSAVNNKITTSVTITCSIQAFEPGDYSLPSITVRAGKKTLTTRPIPFKVASTGQSKGSPGGATAVRPPQGTRQQENDKAFIVINRIGDQAYIGEVIPVEIKAYFRQGLRLSDISYPSLNGSGFVMEQLTTEPLQTREMLDGKSYHVLSWNTVLSAIKEGEHRLQLQLEASVVVPQRRLSTRNSPFGDDFFDNFFGNTTRKPLQAVSVEKEITVLPLPQEGRPETFTGAVGDFSIYASAEPLETESGEPITLNISIRGRGNFDRVEPPEFEQSPDWKIYSPSSNFLANDNTRFSGEKIFEQAIVAKSTDIVEIPSLLLSYFDPRKQTYITEQTPPIPITIKDTQERNPAQAPVAVSQPADAPEPEPAAPTFTGLAPLHLSAGSPVTTVRPLFATPGFLAMIAACLLMLATTTVVALRRARGKNRSVEQRQQDRLQQQLAHSLATIEEARSTSSSAFMAACRSAIQKHLGLLWQCEPGVITMADLRNKLPESTALIEIFSTAEQAAYGATNLSQENMDDTARTLKTALENLV